MNSNKVTRSLSVTSALHPDLSPLMRMNQHRNVLEKYKQSPPSLILHLHPTHFRFEQQDGVFLFTSPLKCILEYIRHQKLPPDLMDVFNETNIPFYDGCIIVEIRDHRPRQNSANSKHSSHNISSSQNSNSVSSSSSTQPSKASIEIRRVALKPTSQSLWSDLCILNESHGGRFSQEVALELEAKILLCTAPPLCLDPNVRVTRIGNAIARAEYATSAAAIDVKKRRRNVGKNSKEMEEEEVKKAETEKIMAMGSEKSGEFLPSFSRMSYVQDWRRKRKRLDTEPVAVLDPKKIRGNKVAKKHAIQEQSILSDGRRIIRTIKCERQEGLRPGHIEKRKIYTTIVLYEERNDKYEVLFRYGTAPERSVDGDTFRLSFPTLQQADAHIDNIKKLLQINNKIEVDIRSVENPAALKINSSGSLTPQQQHKQLHMQQAGLQAATANQIGNGLQNNPNAIAVQMARQNSANQLAAAAMNLPGRSPQPAKQNISMPQGGINGVSTNAALLASAAAAQMNHKVVAGVNQEKVLNSPDLRLLQKQLQQQAQAQATQAQVQAQGQIDAQPRLTNAAIAQMSPQLQAQQLRMQATQAALHQQQQQQQASNQRASPSRAATLSPQIGHASPQQMPYGLQGINAAAMIAQMPALLQQAQNNPQQAAQLRLILQQLQAQRLLQQQNQAKVQAAAALRAGGVHNQPAVAVGTGSPQPANAAMAQNLQMPTAQQAQLQQLLQAQRLAAAAAAAQQHQQQQQHQHQQQQQQHQQHQQLQHQQQQLQQQQQQQQQPQVPNAKPQSSPAQQSQQRPAGLSLQNLIAAGISPQILLAAQQRGINLAGLNLTQLQQLSQMSQRGLY